MTYAFPRCCRHLLILAGISIGMIWSMLSPTRSYAGDYANQEVKIEIKSVTAFETDNDRPIHLSVQHPTPQSAYQQPSLVGENQYHIHSNGPLSKKMTAELQVTGSSNLHLSLGAGDIGQNTVIEREFSATDRHLTLELLTGLRGLENSKRIRYSGHLDNSCADSNPSNCQRPISAVVKLTLIDE